MTEPWMTKREIARELKVSVRTVERLRLPCTPVGGQNRYLMSEVNQALRGEGRMGEVVQLRSVPRDAAA